MEETQSRLLHLQTSTSTYSRDLAKVNLSRTVMAMMSLAVTTSGCIMTGSLYQAAVSAGRTISSPNIQRNNSYTYHVVSNLNHQEMNLCDSVSP